jgi:5'-nucleotidase
VYVLVTNDDGIDASALLPFKQALDQVAETVVFAPDHNWSASGHPKTMHKPLRVDPVTLPDGSQAFSSTGAPSDCVALAFLGIIQRKLDLIVSGINRGANLGYDIFYSGTVAAAVEGVINGIPAIAFSFDSFEPVDYSGPAAFAARLVQYLGRHSLPADMFLNVNFPAIAWDDLKGVAITRLGRRVYRDELVSRTDPRGRPYYWIGGKPPGGVPDSGTDIWAVANGYVSITPVTLDMTAYHFREDMRRWNLQLS